MRLWKNSLAVTVAAAAVETKTTMYRYEMGFLSFCHALHSIVEPNENGASRYDWTGLHFGARFDENLCHFLG